MSASWSGQPLTDLLGALADCAHQDAAIDATVAHLDHVLCPDLVAHVPPNGGPLRRAGAQAHLVDDPTVRALPTVERPALHLGPAGPCDAVVAPVDQLGWLAVARAGTPLQGEEVGLLGGCGQVLGLVARQLRLYGAEREARAQLLDRQHLLEHLYGIQQAIARRDALDDVLRRICQSACTLLGPRTVVGLHLLDRRRPLAAPLLVHSGTGEAPAVLGAGAPATGIGGAAMREGRLVVAADYQASPWHDPTDAEIGVRSAMAAPVARDGVVVGALVSASLEPHTCSELDRETVLTLAEHASLALNDASALQTMAEALDDAVHQATHDPLTGLPNRTLVLERLDQAVARTASTGRPVTLFFLDLDRFKRLNDYLGHRHGDAALVAIADRLCGVLRAEDTVGRMGGDEFVVVAEDLDDHEVEPLARRIAAAVARPLRVDGREATVTASVGVARADAGTRPEDVLGDADLALYRAKDDGRARVRRFDSTLRSRTADRSATEQALHHALRDDQVVTWFQPAVRAETGRPVAVEALARWERPGHGLVLPGEFVASAEDAGLIVELGARILSQACEQVVAWRRRPELEDLGVSVNLSARQLADPRLAEHVLRVLTASGLPPEDLWLEMTEHVFLDEDETTTTNVLALRAAGVHFAIDDFGTGYSSLAYLKRFPVDALKIDRSFVTGLDRDPGDQAIVTAVIRLGAAFGLGVVAEGVERDDELQVLRTLGCDLVQGDLFASAQPADVALQTLLRLAR